MTIFAISDLHLSFTVNKPMDKFGAKWIGHHEKIKENWCSSISDNDWVLLPGDLSWAMTIPEVLSDLEWIHRLPGKKILLKGNHDYWWNSESKVKRILPESMSLLHLNHLFLENMIFIGTRGWLLPVDELFTKDDEKILAREIERFKLSIKSWKTSIHKDASAIAVFHFPPALMDYTETGFTELINQYEIKTVIYGHLHGEGVQLKPPDILSSTSYLCVASDYLAFKPLQITR